jgi:hypothetical protein
MPNFYIETTDADIHEIISCGYAGLVSLINKNSSGWDVVVRGFATIKHSGLISEDRIPEYKAVTISKKIIPYTQIRQMWAE